MANTTNSWSSVAFLDDLTIGMKIGELKDGSTNLGLSFPR